MVGVGLAGLGAVGEGTEADAAAGGHLPYCWIMGTFIRCVSRGRKKIDGWDGWAGL